MFVLKNTCRRYNPSCGLMHAAIRRSSSYSWVPVLIVCKCVCWICLYNVSGYLPKSCHKFADYLFLSKTRPLPFENFAPYFPLLQEAIQDEPLYFGSMRLECVCTLVDSIKNIE